MSSVLERLERLPRRNLTVLAIKGLSTLVPGGWNNITRADALIADVLEHRVAQPPLFPPHARGFACRGPMGRLVPVLGVDGIHP